MNRYAEHQPSRLEVRTVRCPECGAPVGEQCRGRRAGRDGKPYLRDSNHRSRVDLFLSTVEETP